MKFERMSNGNLTKNRQTSDESLIKVQWMSDKSLTKVGRMSIALASDVTIGDYNNVTTRWLVIVAMLQRKFCSDGGR
jgi:hypothetical protein